MTETVATLETDDLARHAQKMAKKKAARDKILATKTIEKGLLIVHTGKGKGKSTAAFGMVFRAIGNGMRVGVVQFVKGKWGTGERKVLDAFAGEVEIATMGEGFTWETQDRARDIAAARSAWERAKAMVLDPGLAMVLLDELNIVLRYDYLPVGEVIEFLSGKPEMKHVIITGRNARDELIEAAEHDPMAIPPTLNQSVDLAHAETVAGPLDAVLPPSA